MLLIVTILFQVRHFVGAQVINAVALLVSMSGLNQLIHLYIIRYITSSLPLVCNNIHDIYCNAFALFN